MPGLWIWEKSGNQPVSVSLLSKSFPYIRYEWGIINTEPEVP